MEREVEALRRNPSVMNGLGITEIVDHYDRIIRDLDTPPVIMGHSFGGPITELLLDRGLGAAAVAISPAQIKGVLRLPPAQIRTVWPALRNPANRNKTVPLTQEQFHFRFTNTMTDAGRRGRLPALLRARSRPGPLPGGIRQLQSARGQQGRRPQGRPRAAARARQLGTTTRCRPR